MTQPEQEAREMLAACPFCGATPHHGLGKLQHCQLHGEPFQDFSVWCPKNHAKITAGTEAEARTQWNTRAPEPAFAGRPTAGIDREVVKAALTASMGWPATLHPGPAADAILALLPAAAKTGARGAVIEECARVCETFPAKILGFWDRPGGPPGNGWRQSTAKDVADAIRALSQPLPDAPIVSGEG